MFDNEFFDMVSKLKHRMEYLEGVNEVLKDDNNDLRYSLRVSHDAESECLDAITREILGQPLHECQGYNKDQTYANLRGIASEIIRKYKELREDVKISQLNEYDDEDSNEA